jgi:hypothetical protein
VVAVLTIVITFLVMALEHQVDLAVALEDHTLMDINTPVEERNLLQVETCVMDGEIKVVTLLEDPITWVLLVAVAVQAQWVQLQRVVVEVPHMEILVEHLDLEVVA